MKPKGRGKDPMALFANESDLHLFLLENLYILESELQLYGQAELEGLQFPCAGRRLDLLAEDKYSGLLAIEVKFGVGAPDALGQILGYMAAIRRMRRFAGRYLRGLVVCGKATEMLLHAAEDAGSVSVYEWTQEPRILRVLEAVDPVLIPIPTTDAPACTPGTERARLARQRPC